MRARSRQTWIGENTERFMGSFSKARLLAERWVELTSDGAAELVRKATIAKSYGWVFFWQSSAALREPNNVRLRLLGNAPFVVFRDSLELKLLGTAIPTELYLKELESKLPRAVLRQQPEQPSW
jgi:hypothetical protein